MPGRSKTQCGVCKKKKTKCGSGAPGCLKSTLDGAGSGLSDAPTTPAAATRRTDRNKTARLTYTHSNHVGMASVLSAQTRINSKRKLAAASKQEHMQKKQAPVLSTTSSKAPKVSLSSFFNFRPPSKQQIQAAKEVASAMRVVEAEQQAEAADATRKKRGGNNIDKKPVKRLKHLLSKGHTAEECKEMVDTFKPVKDARLKCVINVNPLC